MNEALRAELLAMSAEDQRVRSELTADGSLFDGYHPRMRDVHERNAARLEAIIAGHGWPGHSLVGEDGGQAAWLIVQHAISLPPFQRRCLALLEQGAVKGEVPAWQPAYLLDRIRFFEGTPQVYGTQFHWDEQGQMAPYPIENPEHVDERRKRIGLEPLAERIRAVRERSHEEHDRPPRDRAEWNRKYEAWLREVGWRD